MTPLREDQGPACARIAPPPAVAERWFAEEVHAHESGLRTYLRGAFPGVRDIDDLVQESYLRVWRVRMARPILSARAFLFKVARHLAIDHVRRGRVSPLREWEDRAAAGVPEDRPDAAAALSEAEKIELVAAALAALPARCREIFILRKLRQVPQREIAARLGLSERTVESQVTRGMKLCKAWLGRRGVTAFILDEH